MGEGDASSGLLVELFGEPLRVLAQGLMPLLDGQLHRVVEADVGLAAKDRQPISSGLCEVVRPSLTSLPLTMRDGHASERASAAFHVVVGAVELQIDVPSSAEHDGLLAVQLPLLDLVELFGMASHVL